MIVFPNAKINIGLHVTEKRPDGFHNIETIFFPVPDKPGESGRFCDVLEVLPAGKEKNDSLQVTGTPEKIDIHDNLVMKSLSLLREEYSIPPISIHLHKVIPSGAGLGGGSSDAAFMLTLLNEQFELGLSLQQLEKKAALLGADCAFFIQNAPTLARGKGNEFSAITLSLEKLWLMIVIPPIHLPTAQAYKNIHPHLPSYKIKKTIEKDPAEWSGRVVNDFEINTFARHPEIEKIKQTLYSYKALYASMSGSGSSVYGFFREKPEIEWPKNYKQWCGQIE